MINLDLFPTAKLDVVQVVPKFFALRLEVDAARMWAG